MQIGRVLRQSVIAVLLVAAGFGVGYMVSPRGDGAAVGETHAEGAGRQAG